MPIGSTEAYCRLTDLCGDLGMSCDRIEQWIACGYFRPRHAISRGHQRLFDRVECLRLMIFGQLVDEHCLSPRDAKFHVPPTIGIHEGEDALLVIWKGWFAVSVSLKLKFDGQLYHEIVRRCDLPIWSNSDKDVLIALPVDELVEWADSVFARLEKKARIEWHPAPIYNSLSARMESYYGCTSTL